MGGILQVDTIQNNNASTIITQTNTTTLTFGRSGQTIVIPSGTTFNASSASVNIPAVNLATGVTGTLPIGNGGTGLTTYTTGDLLYASNATTLTKLGIGTTGQAVLVSGGVPSWGNVGASAGQVIQVVSANDNTQRSTTSTTYVTGSNTLSVTITPSATANKIFLICHSNIYSNSGTVYLTIYRDSTNIGAGTQSGFQLFFSVYSTLDSLPFAMTYLDSPNTTSAITYQVYFKVGSGTAYLNQGAVRSVLTAMEIKG